jgi:hypothetical protein
MNLSMKTLNVKKRRWCETCLRSKQPVYDIPVVIKMLSKSHETIPLRGGWAFSEFHPVTS